MTDMTVNQVCSVNNVTGTFAWVQVASVTPVDGDTPYIMACVVRQVG
jgi:hypothetical protein